MSENQRGIDGKTFAIGVLSVTACVLLVGFLLVSLAPKPAYGRGQLDRSGDYIMLTQQISESSEGVVIVDAAAKQMIMYEFDYNNNRLVPLPNARIPLDKLRQPREEPGKKAPGR